MRLRFEPLEDRLLLSGTGWDLDATPLETSLAAQSAADSVSASWPFNESSGTITHDQGPHGFVGTLRNGAAFADGVLGNGLALDGEDDYVNITDGAGYPELLGAFSAGTISVWFKFDRLTAAGEIFPVFCLGDGVGGSGNSQIIVEIGHFDAGNSKLYFTVYADNNSIPECFDTALNLQPNTWYHFAAVVGPTGNTGYLNGQELTARHYNFGNAASSYFIDDVVDQRVLWIGRGFLAAITADQFFDGNIDEVRVCDRPLSSGEIEQYYNEVLDGSGTGILPGADEKTLFGEGRQSDVLPAVDEDIESLDQPTTWDVGASTTSLEDRSLLSNAAPTDIALPLSSVLEQQPAGTPVGMFTTVDPDALSSFTYTLVSGEGSADNASFTIDSTGNLLTASTFDFQARSAYSIRVRSTDQGDLSVEKAFTVTVTQLTGQRVDLVSAALLSSTGNSYSIAASVSGDGRYVAFQSDANDLVAGDTNGRDDIFVKDLISGVTTLVSTDSSAVPGNSWSENPSISADGRYVAFQSSASNLVSGDTNGKYDVFVKDLVSGVTTRVSTNSSAAQGNSDSSIPSISGDGRYVAFRSASGNLVAGDTNGKYDIFVKDLVSNATTRVSTDSSGLQGDNDCLEVSISADGRYVAFRSFASNMVSGDTNATADVFVKDRTSGITTRASTDSAALQGNNASFDPSISDDGRYVAFQSFASNLVSGDTNGREDVFVKDLVSGITVRVSTDSAAVQGNNGSYDPSISSDGRCVAFRSAANNLVSGDTNGGYDVFIKVIASGATTRVSTNSSALQGNGGSYAPSISSDGRYVAFHSAANNLVSGDTNGAYDVFVKDVASGATGLGSTRDAANPPLRGGPGDSSTVSTSGDGRYVAFQSAASNLVSGDTNGKHDIFVRDLALGVTTRASTSTAAVQGNNPSYNPTISGDGRYVAFVSTASNLVSGDTNGTYDVFVKDLVSGVTTRVSTDSSTLQGNSDSYGPSISGDGRYVAFYSIASNLVSGDTNGTYDVFVKDVVSGVTTRVSTDSSAVPGNSTSSTPRISDDGRYVAFRSAASNLVSGDTNGSWDIFVKDLVSGVTTRMSTDNSAVQGNGDSHGPSISGDGRYIAFYSCASNLVSGDTNGTYDIFVKDSVSGVTTLVSTDTSPVQGNDSSCNPSISGDGRYVAFVSYASNLVSDDTNGAFDIFVKDLFSGGTTRVSADGSAAQGNGDSFNPSISGDGRYVAFSSDASNLHPWDATTTADVFRVSNFATTASSNLDADGNGTADALTDSILILRYLFDPNGQWNYSDALGSGAARSTHPAIKSFLDGGRTTVFDADGNGTPDALTDGILILRYLFDPSGAWNYSDALGAGATRTTRTAIQAYLDTFNPSLAPPDFGAVVMAETSAAPFEATTGDPAQDEVATWNFTDRTGAQPDDDLVAAVAAAVLMSRGSADTLQVKAGDSVLHGGAANSYAASTSGLDLRAALDRIPQQSTQPANWDERAAWSSSAGLISASKPKEEAAIDESFDVALWAANTVSTDDGSGEAL